MRSFGRAIYWTWLLSGLFLGCTSAQAGRPEPVQVECPVFSGWARLGSYPGCRLRFEWPERKASVCLSSEAAWARFDSEASCFLGRWKVRSPPFIGVGWNRKKRVELQFLAQAGASDRVQARSRPFALWGRLSLKVERLRFRLSLLLEKSDPSGVLRSLLLGQSAGAAASLLRELGHVHVMAATGIHLYAVARVTEGSLRWTFAKVPWASGFWVQQSVRAVSKLVWLWIWILAGARPGMLRPLAVVVLRMGAETLGVRWRPWAPLLVSLSVDLAVAMLWTLLDRPGAWAPGRWLYAGAVGGGLLALEQVRGRGILREHAAMSVGSWVLVAPFEALLRGWVAPATPLWSLIEIPILTSFVYPLAVAVSVFLAADFTQLSQGLSAILGQAVGLGLEGAAALSMQIPGALWLVSPFPVLLAWVCAVISWGRSTRFVLGFLLLLGLGRLTVSWASSELSAQDSSRSDLLQRIVQLDVGQGDAAWLESSSSSRRTRRLGWVDVGSERAWSEGLAWEWLGKNRSWKFDYILLTHLDQDHAGALMAWVSRVPVRCVVTSRFQWESPRGRELADQLREIGIRVHSVELDLGKPLAERCFPFTMIPPQAPAHSMNLGKLGANFAMTGVWVPFPDGGGYLNWGDADQIQEHHFLRANLNTMSRASIFKLSHHGSKTSTANEVVAELQPERVWLSVGLGNSYGHPHEEVLGKLNQAGWGTRLERTDRSGNLEWRRGRPSGASSR